jgi:hypothetical protein
MEPLPPHDSELVWVGWSILLQDIMSRSWAEDDLAFWNTAHKFVGEQEIEDAVSADYVRVLQGNFVKEVQRCVEGGSWEWKPGKKEVEDGARGEKENKGGECCGERGLEKGFWGRVKMQDDRIKRSGGLIRQGK